MEPSTHNLMPLLHNTQLHQHPAWGTQCVLGFREELMHLACRFINDPTSPDAERHLT
jgi:hypothetical protein